MIKALYPGSFDPMTLGHVDIIDRLHKFYDELIVLIAQSPKKNYLFSAEERKIMAEAELSHLPNIRVECFDGLTTEFARKNAAKAILRGLRAVSDFEYEMAMANMNRRLAPEVETLIVFSKPELNHVSSRSVKEVASHGGPLTGLVSSAVAEKLVARLRSAGL